MHVVTRFGVMVLLAALATPAPADAVLAVFTDGRVLKVEDAQLVADRIVLTLVGGGILEVPAVRIEQVVADEVEAVPLPPPATAYCAAAWNGEALPAAMPFRDEIASAAEAANLHPWLLVALVEAESAFDPDAVSRAGAKGLTQLMPSAAADLGVADPLDPAANLRGGARHLRWLLDRFGGDLTLALAAYNAGPTTVERFDGVPPYRETRSYIRRVLEAFCPSPPG